MAFQNQIHAIMVSHLFKWLLTLVSNFLYNYAIQIIMFSLLKLFIGFSRFCIFVWTPCFMFNNLHHIPLKKYSLLTLIFLGFLVVCLDHISRVPHSHPLNCFSSHPLIIFTYVIIVLAPSFQFFLSHPCALGNMATFHVVGCLDFTIMVNDSRTTSIFK
jgi:hypothetical protein